MVIKDRNGHQSSSSSNGSIITVVCVGVVLVLLVAVVSAAVLMRSSIRGKRGEEGMYISAHMKHTCIMFFLQVGGADSTMVSAADL